jgi:hypothetical protein
VSLLRRALLACVLFGALLAPSEAASAARPSFFVGADEDALVWGNSAQTASTARTLGLHAVRITLQWRPGQSKVPAVYQEALNRLLLDAWGLRVVVSVYGQAADAPRSDEARGQYCAFVADLLTDNPTIADVAIWNDPNDGAFWSPQFGPGGTSIAPADYEALLAQCWDRAHSVRKDANVIAVAVSKNSAIPGAFTLDYHPPATWFRKLATVYTTSGRTQPIFDTLGYIPHPTSSTERPWTKHPASSAISLGDYATLVQTLSAVFRGTPQPVPGQTNASIWYMAQGFQTAPDAAKASLYGGAESDTATVPAWSPQEAGDTGSGAGLDQPLQLADAIKVAYCQPGVGAYFNFHLVDERNLAGWQSGVFWADGSPKPAYQALRRVAGEVNSKSIDCTAFFPSGMPPRSAPVQQRTQTNLQILDLRATSVSAFGATVAWQATLPARVQVGYGLADYGIPTMWAPADTAAGGSSASLAGLDTGSTYRVWVSAFSDDGQRAQASVDLRTPGLPQHPQVGLGKPTGTVLLDGQAFFPMMLYSVCPYQYAAALDSGINLFALNACGTLQAQLNALGGAAFSAAVAGGNGGSGSGLIGWFHHDEPDGTNLPASALPGPPAGVPSLSFLTLTNHFYSGAAPLPWGRSAYPSLIATADVVGFDLYPLQEWCMPHRMADVFHSQQELVTLSGDKPTFQWIEADNWKCSGANTVTPATVRAESWLAIAGGAHGLGFWPAHWSPAVGRTIAAVRRDVARLGPAVYAPNQPASDNDPHVVVSARSSAGGLYVFAVNAGWTATDAKIAVPGLGGRTLTAMGESRRLSSLGESFTDHFAPLAVHIYIAPPADS